MTGREQGDWPIMEAYLWIARAMNVLENPKLFRYQYVELLAQGRDLIVKFENIGFGCPSGLHKDQCTCKPGNPGRTWRTIKERNQPNKGG